MITATNPITGDNMELAATTEVGEIITADDGTMFEVTVIENGQANLSEVSVDEDWGQ